MQRKKISTIGSREKVNGLTGAYLEVRRKANRKGTVEDTGDSCRKEERHSGISPYPWLQILLP